ncbi:hypothetical protein H6G06_24410 [Anabaena sphaerica FACHB-251]|uniref:Uncharacterized protein n=1 Tax=Anabaena sphaerica FACHB-251 TaxID=2692883 RepID=A0A926WL16_9NOST|nr:hypothetical protein [Anabaena sphaerica]MBD2296535.1 hypothetical protein [Anabaena sphaerica FACHB-251]
MPSTVTLTITTGKLSGKQYIEVIDLALTEKPQIYFQTAIEFKEALLKSI